PHVPPPFPTRRSSDLDGALSLAARTRRAEDAAHEDLARTAALRAGLRPAAGARSGALAFRTAYGPLDGDLPLGAQHRVAQVHLRSEDTRLNSSHLVIS